MLILLFLLHLKLLRNLDIFYRFFVVIADILLSLIIFYLTLFIIIIYVMILLRIFEINTLNSN